MTNNFKDLVVWQKAYSFILHTYQITQNFPEAERFGLSSQFRRAAVSIGANIAEGYKKLSKADKLRFMNIAQGSLEECRFYTMLSKDLQYITEDEFHTLSFEIEGTSIYLNKYCRAIKENRGITDSLP